ncbi:MAG: RrF2 family transcriptional regulator [Chitinispirillaceae bacterium]|nr:RrF2 family transcriptional regulator [Chitinispirillaceae bacterium]
MKLSTKSRYGLRAVIEIAKAYGSTPAKRKHVAANQGISDSYLENILIVLKNNRIIETTRGVKGGYILSRPPREITVLDVVNSLEGPLDLVDCVNSNSNCAKTETCATRTIWKELTDAWESILGKMTLQDVIDREERLYSPMYTI